MRPRKHFYVMDISMLTCEKNSAMLHPAALQQTMRPMRTRNLQRRRQMNPFSAKPRLRRLPARYRDSQDRLLAIQRQCSTNECGCWLFPRVRDEAFPYIDLRNDDGEREQWSARRHTWTLKNGDIPERGLIIGMCLYTACVNPDHQALWVPPLQLDWVGP